MHRFKVFYEAALAKVKLFERQFLGPKSYLFEKKLIFLTINEHNNCSLNHLIGSSHHKTPILISAEPILGFVGLWLRPTHLEQVPVMIEKVKSLDPLLIIAHSSMLPSKNELDGGQFSFSEVINLFIAFKKLHHEGMHLIVLEYEQSLGAKKSALLERLMNT